MFFSQHLVEVWGRGNEFGIFNLSVPIQINLVHDLGDLTFKEQLITKELFESLLDLISRQYSIVVHIKLFKYGKETVLILLCIHTIGYVSEYSLLELSFTMKVF